MKGRKPKPTVMKRLAGNPGKRPLNLLEPVPRRALPRCPAHLDAEAKKCWHRLARELYNSGILTTVDRDMLAVYCQVYSRWKMAEEIVQAKGPVIKTAQGNLIQNPFLSIANRCIDQMAKLAGEFGLTPSTRTRLKAEPGENEPTLAELLFTGVGDE